MKSFLLGTAFFLVSGVAFAQQPAVELRSAPTSSAANIDAIRLNPDIPPRCPQEKPTLCDDGRCVMTEKDCVVLQPVPGALPELPGFPEDEEEECPVRCADGSCVRERSDCPDTEAAEAKKKGNVEYEWQVEEGEGIPPAPTDPNTVRDNGETEAATDVFIKIPDIDGESKDEDNTGQADPSDVAQPLPDPEQAAGYLKIGDIKGETQEAAKKKPKEIVVVGSKAREENTAASNFAILLSGGGDKIQVKTEEELEDFAVAVAQSDENMEEISLNYEKIKVKYKQPAKVLGFIPVNYTMDVEADQEGRIKVKKPWWLFMTKHEATHIVQQLEEEVPTAAMNKADLTETLANSTDDDASAGDGDAQLANIDLQQMLQRQQQTLQAISNIMKMSHDTAMGIIRNMK